MAAESAPEGSAQHLETTSAAYTERLRALQGTWWKRALHVQAPYRWNVRRHLGDRPTIDLGCGIGRNLATLAPGSMGVDHNPTSVAFCRATGREAYVPEDFFRLPDDARPRDGLLAAHVLEHLPPGSQTEFLAPYVATLRPGATVMIVCPQERGFRSDPSHTDFVDGPRIVEVLRALGLAVDGWESFPFPRWAGNLFVYNEFVVVGRVASQA
ncbi:bifunctional 2-polyprenyl-6-hydroxyphenol methylase/3-demethylubiquinol 3-O-methyltransferase UbiG [Cellulosimicrobium sp. KWT-B]|uniref:class I SAM-dependent methyltransferase n=1 Tax=Cellulosimicrobium sp. KWT-B TaxID=1981152 RepID=UPI0018E9AF12|nr:class I SAM-dependent methyltransferase [Cellulosimicrobium sp. KWT-B]